MFNVHSMTLPNYWESAGSQKRDRRGAFTYLPLWMRVAPDAASRSTAAVASVHMMAAKKPASISPTRLTTRRGMAGSAICGNKQITDRRLAHISGRSIRFKC